MWSLKQIEPLVLVGLLMAGFLSLFTHTMYTPLDVGEVARVALLITLPLTGLYASMNWWRMKSGQINTGKATGLISLLGVGLWMLALGLCIFVNGFFDRSQGIEKRFSVQIIYRVGHGRRQRCYVQFNPPQQWGYSNNLPIPCRPGSTSRKDSVLVLTVKQGFVGYVWTPEYRIIYSSPHTSR